MRYLPRKRIGSPPRTRHVLAGFAALIGGLHANVAQAHWGENWGETRPKASGVCSIIGTPLFSRKKQCKLQKILS